RVDSGMRPIELAVPVIGLLAGVAVAVGMGDAPESPGPVTVTVVTSPAPASPASEVPADCVDVVAFLEEERTSLERRRDTARLVQRAQTVRRQQREGTVQPWPDEVTGVLRPSAFEAAVSDAAAQTGFTVLAVECAEFPCIARVEKTEGLKNLAGSSEEDLQVLLAALGPDYANLSSSMIVASLQAGPPPVYRASFVLADRELPDARRRLEWRMEQLAGEGEP
ncbi:MAG: hypothetical protein AAF602_22355, partial [Myxococcota bacterium]